MEIATFISGGVLALVSRALYDTVVSSNTKITPPSPPPLPMQLLLPKSRVPHIQKPRVKMFVSVIPADADLTQSYIGYNRSEMEPSDNVPIPARIEMMTQSAPPFTRDPNLVNVTRLKHIEPVRPKVIERNESDICKQLELGKTKLKKPSL